MGDSQPLGVARAYHRAWSTRDLDKVGQYLADDLQVEVPINSYSGKADFLEAVQRTAQHTASVKLLAELGDGDQAMLLYDMTLPIGQLRVAEHFTISGGKIHKVCQIHDTAALRAAGMGR
jgi:hypothetical protein